MLTKKNGCKDKILMKGLRISTCIFILYMVLPLTGLTQHHCATDYIHLQRIKNDTTYAKAYKNFVNQLEQSVILKKIGSISGVDSIFTIPVVVHIVHNNAAGTIGGPGNINISDEQIASQIAILNQDYKKA